MQISIIKKIVIFLACLLLFISIGTGCDGKPATPPDAKPPVINNIREYIYTASSIKIMWETDELADSQLEYGTTYDYGLISTLNSKMETYHNVTLTGLNPGTTYHYRVKSTDISGNRAISEDKTFVTPDILATIKLDVTASTWRTDEEPYDVYGSVKEELEKAFFEVVPVSSSTYDGVLAINYREEKGDLYSWESGPTCYATNIYCDIKLYDRSNMLLFEKKLSCFPVETFTISSPSKSSASGENLLYQNALTHLENDVYFRYLGEFCATKFGIDDEISVLISALDDGVQQGAMEALVKIGGPAVESLIKALKDEDEHTREKAAGALGEIGDTRAVEPLIQTLEDKYWLARQEAAKALGKIGDKRAIEPLNEALNDKEIRVRTAAKEALNIIQGSN